MAARDEDSKRMASRTTENPGVGVLGGTFDPPHLGHLIAAQAALHQLQLGRILFIPNRKPPHKANRLVTSFDDRVEMVRLAIAANPAFHLDLREIERPGPSYALDTLRSIQQELKPDTELMFILGFDALRELETWHEPDALVAEFRFAVLDRPGDEGGTRDEAAWQGLEQRFPTLRPATQFIRMPRIDISSHEIRRRVRAGQPIRYMVPRTVELYIRERGLYGR